MHNTCSDITFQPPEYDDDDDDDDDDVDDRLIDAMNNIYPDNHFYNNIPTNSKYYSDQQFVSNVKSESNLSFIFIHFNARSLDKNVKKIKDFIDDIKQSFDIIAISETWADSSTTDDYSQNGYEVFHIVIYNRKGGV